MRACSVLYHPLTTPAAGPEAQCLDWEAEGSLAIRGVNMGKSRSSPGFPTRNLPPADSLSFLPALPTGSAIHGKAAGRWVTRTLPGLGRARYWLRCPFNFPELWTLHLGKVRAYRSNFV